MASFTATTRPFATAFEKVAAFAPDPKSIEPGRDSVFLRSVAGRLSLTAFNGQQEIRMEIPSVKPDADFSCVVPARRAAAALSSITEPSISLDCDPDRVLIRHGRSSFRLACIDSAPRRIQAIPANVTMAATGLLAAIRRVTPVVRSDEEGSALCEWTRDRAALVSYDGARIVIQGFAATSATESINNPGPFLPFASLRKLSSVIPQTSESVSLGFSANSFLFRGPNTLMGGRLTSGKFVPYRKIAADPAPYLVTLPADRMLNAITQASLFCGDDSRIVTLKFGAGVMEISSSSSEADSRVILENPQFARPLSVSYAHSMLSQGLSPLGSAPAEIRFSKTHLTAIRHESYEYRLCPVEMPS